MSNIHKDLFLADYWYPMVKKWEGCQLRMYRCPAGKRTIGVGFNLDRRGGLKLLRELGIVWQSGIDEEQARLLCIADFMVCISEARQMYQNYDELTPKARAIIADMIFNMGSGTLKKFQKFKRAIENYDYEKAAIEMKRSKWGRTSHRAKKYIPMMREAGQC